MADPIITAEELLKDCGLSPLAWRVDLVKRALAQARAEGRLAGMEEAAREIERGRELMAVVLAAVDAFAEQPAQRLILTGMFSEFRGIGGWGGWSRNAKRWLKATSAEARARTTKEG